MINSALSQVYDAKKHAIVNARNLRISTKDSVEIAHKIKGMDVKKAKTYLEGVLKKKNAVPVKRFTEGAGHKAQVGGPGTYPITAAVSYISILSSAEKNAEFKGLDDSKLKVLHASATIGSRFHRPRRTNLRGQVSKSTNISVIVGEKK